MNKVYILDTNTLVDNPNCISIFRNGIENKVLITYSTILELDRIKNKQTISHLVREVVKRIYLDDKLEIIRIPNKKYSEDSKDSDIIEDIKFYRSNNLEINPIIVSNDSIFRLRLKLDGFEVQEFLGGKEVFKSESQAYTGIVNFDEDKPENSFYWDSTGRLYFEADEKEMNFDHAPWNIKPRTVYQNCAMHLMLNPNIDVTSIHSDAGYGKTYIALASAFQLTLQKPKLYEKIFIFKPIVEIGEKLGFLPGDEQEKLMPYMRGIMDLILKLHSQRAANSLFIDAKAQVLELNPKQIEVMSINFIRGMNIENAVVIIDEAQNLTRYQARALLTRFGENVKCFILGDTNQIDSPYLNSSNNALNWIVRLFKGNKNYGHMVLKGNKSRGPICDLTLKTGL